MVEVQDRVLLVGGRFVVAEATGPQTCKYPVKPDKPGQPATELRRGSYGDALRDGYHYSERRRAVARAEEAFALAREVFSKRNPSGGLRRHANGSKRRH